VPELGAIVRPVPTAFTRMVVGPLGRIWVGRPSGNEKVT
jgi:hypothetical protein